ncbi:MAG: hypothetical protein ACM3UO_00240 [Bacillota bacterium]
MTAIIDTQPYADKSIEELEQKACVSGEIEARKELIKRALKGDQTARMIVRGMKPKNG